MRYSQELRQESRAEDATMLGNSDVIAFVSTTDSDRAKTFYSEILGLRLVTDTPFAIVFDAGRTMLRVSKVEKLTPAPYTVLGWKVTDIRTIAAAFMKKGVAFERYNGLQQDEFGIWTTPDGHQVSWFKDPDGNTLSLTQFLSE
jgi:catechol 2,3-dioxygenase-like lactoylglutathione lyase family enzyme